MWTPQFAARGSRTGYGIGFRIGELNGRRLIGHDGAIYGFATTLLGMPDDSLGVVVVATLDGANAVTDRIATSALRLATDVRAGRPVATIDTTSASPTAYALTAIGRYENAKTTYDLEEYEGRLFLVPARGGFRAELRQPAHAGEGELIADDALSYGTRVRLLDTKRIIVDSDTLTRVPRPVATIPIATPKPAAARSELTPLIGEYGWNHDVLFIREKDGQLNALIEWFFEYPLTRVSKNIYRFPAYGLYDGEEIVFRGTGAVPTTNFYRSGIDAHVKRGVHFAVCDLSTNRLKAAIAKSTDGKPEAIYKELTGNAMGNAHFVAAGILAVNRAQERGYAMSYTG